MRLMKKTAMTAIALVLATTAAMAEESRIMVFGDSNTWGWIPQENVVPTMRYDAATRWPGVMSGILGEGYEVVEEGLSARTAATDDPSLGIAGAGMNGLEYLPAAIASNMPLDLVVIMLGTNDVKPGYGHSPLDISLDLLELASTVQKSTGVATSYAPAKVLIVAPPPLGKIADVEWLQALYTADSVQKSKDLPGILGPMAEAAGIAFMDAGQFAALDGVDGLHMSAEQQAALGTAVAAKVAEIMAK